MAKIDLKIKPTKVEKTCCPERSRYPSLYLSDAKLPLAKTSIGKTMKAIVTLKLTGLRENTSTGRNEMSWDFDIHDIEFSGRNIAENNAKEKLKEVFEGK
jgi:hypothetical protein